MSKTFRHPDRFYSGDHYKVTPTKNAQGWLDGELAHFREEERDSLSDLIDAASMAAWVADQRDAEHR